MSMVQGTSARGAPARILKLSLMVLVLSLAACVQLERMAGVLGVHDLRPGGVGRPYPGGRCFAGRRLRYGLCLDGRSLCNRQREHGIFC